MNIKPKLGLAILCLFLPQFMLLQGQIITGKLVDESTNLPIEFVSIGIIGTRIGEITNEKGIFSLDINASSNSATVRFSMIGYKPQTFSVEQLLNKENTIHLKVEDIQIKAIVIKPGGKLREVGTSGYSIRGGCCGWGGENRGKGHEIGTKLDLGSLPVRIQSLHIRVFQQAFDSSLFRLHVRSIVNNLPGNEMLNENIFILVTKKSGWQKIDLSKYNLVFKGEIALTLEWVKVIGLNINKLLNMDGAKVASANILFNKKSTQGCIYTKWGVENKWIMHENVSPSIYLTVQ